jgi:hypothetical protein
MFIIQEARLAQFERARAEEVLRIASVDRELSRSESLGNAFRHSDLSLNFKWEQMHGIIKSGHESSLSRMTQHVGSLETLLAERAEKALRDSETTFDNLKRAEVSLEENLKKDLKTIREHFERIFRETMDESRAQLYTDRDRVQSQARKYLDTLDEIANSHYANIRQLHQQGEEMLESYFKALIEQNLTEIEGLSSSIESLKSEIAAQELEISDLNSQNAVVSKPLEELKARKQLLDEKLGIVDSGTMACRNFRTSVSSLTKKLQRIEEDIIDKQNVLFDLSFKTV